MSLSDERVKLFANRCADLGKRLGVDVVDLYTLFHEQPVRPQAVYLVLTLLSPNIIIQILLTCLRRFY